MQKMSKNQHILSFVAVFAVAIVLMSISFLGYEAELQPIAMLPNARPSSCPSYNLVLYAIFTRAERYEQREIFRRIKRPKSVTVRFVVGQSPVDISAEIIKYGDIIELPIPEHTDNDGKTFAFFQHAWQHFGCFRYFFKAIL